jgi:hypothetical protein
VDKIVAIYQDSAEGILTQAVVVDPIWKRYKALMEETRRDRLAEGSLLALMYTPQSDDVKKLLRGSPAFKLPDDEAPLDVFEFLFENNLAFAKDQSAFNKNLITRYAGQETHVFKGRAASTIKKALYRLFKKAQQEARELGFEPVHEE